MHVEVGLHQGGQVGWQMADFGGLESVFIDQTGHFDTTAPRQVVNQAFVGDIPINGARLACFHTVNNERTIFDTAFDFERNFNSRDAIQWTVENRKLSVMLAAAYVAVIFGLKRFMRHREKLSLRLPLALWSGALAAFSIAATARLVPESVYTVYNHGWQHSVCVPTAYFGDTGVWGFLFLSHVMVV